VGVLIAGMVVMATFLLTSAVMFGTFLATTVSQGQSLKELTEMNQKRAGSALSITAASVDSPGGTDVTVQAGNTGNQSVTRFGEMDVILRYTDVDDKAVLTYLRYSSIVLGDNQWTVAVTGVQPDSFNPKMWDPGESLPLDLRVNPAIKSGTPAQVVVGTPWGVSDLSSVVNP